MPRQFTQEFRERAIRLVDESLEGTDRSECEVITEVATRLGCSTEALRRWRRRNEILSTASAFFASRLDHPSPR